MNAEMIVPMLTAPKGLAYHSQHIIIAVKTIDASKRILTVENLQPVTMAIASTHPSPGSGAILAGMYTNMPKAIRKILTIKNTAIIRTEPSKGICETTAKANVLK